MSGKKRKNRERRKTTGLSEGGGGGKGKRRRLPDYDSPHVVGSLGGVGAYARAAKIPVRKARKIVEKKLSYTLHKPVRKRGKYAPLMVFDIDEQ